MKIKTPQQLNRLLAQQYFGWLLHGDADSELACWKQDPRTGYPATREAEWDGVNYLATYVTPDFCRDIAKAMELQMLVAREGLHEAYMRELLFVLWGNKVDLFHCDIKLRDTNDLMPDLLFAIANATPLQRAWAAARVKLGDVDIEFDLVVPLGGYRAPISLP